MITFFFSFSKAPTSGETPSSTRIRPSRGHRKRRARCSDILAHPWPAGDWDRDWVKTRCDGDSRARKPITVESPQKPVCAVYSGFKP